MNTSQPSGVIGACAVKTSPTLDVLCDQPRLLRGRAGRERRPHVLRDATDRVLRRTRLMSGCAIRRPSESTT